MATQSENLRNFKKFSENLKKTSLGVKFGKALFTKPSSLSPRLIVDMLRALGLNVPREAIITADIAQMIITGQAAIRAYNDAKSFNEISNSSAASIAAGVRIASELGWINDKDGSVATTIQLGTDVGLLISSCGADWQAWASLALSAWKQNVQNEMIATKLAAGALQASVEQYLSVEQRAFTANFAELNSGKIGVLGWLTKNALTSPALFMQRISGNQDLIKKFPFLANVSGLPTSTITFRGSAQVSDTFLGLGEFNQQSENLYFTMETLSKFADENQAREWIFKALIEPQLVGYQYANKYFTGRAISVENLSIMYGIGAPIGYIYPGQDVSPFLQTLKLTPSDMGETFIQNFLSADTRSTVSYLKSASISMSGTQSFRKPTQPDIELFKKEILKADLRGDANYLYQFKEVRERAKLYGTYNFIPDNYKMGIGRGGEKIQVGEYAQDWRRLSNFTLGLQYLDMVRNDPYYFGWESESLKKYDFMRSIKEYENKAQYLFSLSMFRKVNTMALGNVAFFLGTTPDKVQKINPGADGAGIFTVKG